MNYLLLIIALIPSFSWCSTASNDTLFYDKDWKQVKNRDSAQYYGFHLSKNGEYIRLDYYMNHQLYMSGTYLDKEYKIKNGEFLFYYVDGIISGIESYENGKLEGAQVRYNSTGTLIAEVHYKAGIPDESHEPYVFHVPPFESVNIPPSIPESSPSVFVEEAAEFPGGYEALSTYLAKNIKYPKSALKRGIDGEGRYRITISEQGMVSDVKALKSIPGCPECDQEVIQVLNKMPDWKPARAGKKNVKSYYDLPVTFSAQKDRK